MQVCMCKGSVSMYKLLKGLCVQPYKFGMHYVILFTYVSKLLNLRMCLIYIFKIAVRKQYKSESNHTESNHTESNHTEVIDD